MMSSDEQATFLEGVTERWRAASRAWVNDHIYRECGSPDRSTDSLSDIELILIVSQPCRAGHQMVEQPSGLIFPEWVRGALRRLVPSTEAGKECAQ